jgi:hypothetical protein
MRDIDEIRSELDSIRGQIKMDTHAILALEADREAHRNREDELENELARARAAGDRNTWPVGTRVRHYLWSSITGTVVESDGTGVSVHQDRVFQTRHGYAKHEWRPIEDTA